VPLRVGIVPYLNVLPFFHRLREAAPNWTIEKEYPARLADGLDSGRFELAVLPTFDYLTRRGRYTLVPDVSIASDGPARSVLLVSDVPIEQVRVAERDACSHTSNALARVLLDGPLGRPDLVLSDEGTHNDADAREILKVRIGDRALCEGKHARYAIDMGQAWREWQGLPFVFAVWAGRGDKPWQDIGRFLGEMRDRNLCDLDTLLGESSHPLPAGYTIEEAKDYFGNCLYYRLGDRELAAIERFDELTRNR
jgi:chorismate dehydratase